MKETKTLSDFIKNELADFSFSIFPIQSRNDGLMDGDMFHYFVSISSPDGQVMSLNFSTGKGRVEKLTSRGWERFNGPVSRKDITLGKVRASKPTAVDIWGSLLMDLDESMSFEDFCANFGYDEDSRKAEKIWRTTIEQTRNVRRILGARLFEEARNCENDI